MPRLQILEPPKIKRFKKGFVIHLKGYHGDMDYSINESYHCDVQCIEDEEWMAMAYLGYIAIKEHKNPFTGEVDEDKVIEDMGGKEAVNKYGFDWPIDPWNKNRDGFMTVESCTIEYHDGNGYVNQVEVVK